MSKTPQEKARALLGALSAEDLRALQEDIDDLLTVYAGDEESRQAGYIELKFIPKTLADGSQVEYGPYAYLRRWDCQVPPPEGDYLIARDAIISVRSGLAFHSPDVHQRLVFIGERFKDV